MDLVSTHINLNTEKYYNKGVYICIYIKYNDFLLSHAKFDKW